MLGSDPKTAAEIESWISFADEEIFNKAIALFQLFNGTFPFNKPSETKHWDDLNRAFKYLENHLKKQTFIVGHRLTLADLTIASDLAVAFRRAAGAEFRDQYPNVMRYYNTIINQPTILDVYKNEAPMLEQNAKFTPPAKEAKPKSAAPPSTVPAAVPAAAKKADKKKKDDDEDDDDEPKAAPPPKHALASLPPSPFILDEAKRNYSNWETPDFVKWFYEHFDKEGYSIWRFDFKYNEVSPFKESV